MRVLFDLTTCVGQSGRFPSGIARVEAALAAEFAAALGPDVLFVRVRGRGPFEQVDAQHLRLILSQQFLDGNRRTPEYERRQRSPLRAVGRTLERGVRRTIRRLTSLRAPNAAAGSGSPDAPVFSAGIRAWIGLSNPPPFLHFGGNWDLCRFAAALRSQSRPVTLIHDLLPIDHPEWFSTELTTEFTQYIRKFCFSTCDLLFTYSEYTRNRLLHHLSFSASDCRVARLAIGADALPEHLAPADAIPAFDLHAPFFMTVGNLSARKNQNFLLDVWELAALDGVDLPRLAIIGWDIGMPPGYADELRARIAGSPALAGRVVILDQVGDAALAQYYRRALALLYPSLGEGWGLPVTEALRVALPCITSDRGSIPEAGAGRARVLPLDHRAWLETVSAWRLPPGDRPWFGIDRSPFAAPSWRDAAETILAELEPLSARSAGDRRPAPTAGLDAADGRLAAFRP